MPAMIDNKGYYITVHNHHQQQLMINSEFYEFLFGPVETQSLEWLQSL
jgi:hypothetical protein